MPDDDSFDELVRRARAEESLRKPDRTFVGCAGFIVGLVLGPATLYLVSTLMGYQPPASVNRGTAAYVLAYLFSAEIGATAGTTLALLVAKVLVKRQKKELEL